MSFVFSENETRFANQFSVSVAANKHLLRASGQFRSPAQVENQLLAVNSGAPRFVRDVAEVKLGFKKPDGMVRRFGESSIAINCLRETGANVLDAMDGLQATVADIDKNLLQARAANCIADWAAWCWASLLQSCYAAQASVGVRFIQWRYTHVLVFKKSGQDFVGGRDPCGYCPDNF